MTEQCLNSFAAEATPVSGWFVTAGHPLIRQRFYAAINGAGSLCWTDDPTVAEQFPLPQDAERFAEMLCPNEDWSVTNEVDA